MSLSFGLWPGRWRWRARGAPPTRGNNRTSLCHILQPSCPPGPQLSRCSCCAHATSCVRQDRRTVYCWGGGGGGGGGGGESNYTLGTFTTTLSASDCRLFAGRAFITRRERKQEWWERMRTRERETRRTALLQEGRDRA